MSQVPPLLISPLAVELSGMNLTFVAIVAVVAILALVMALYFRREVLSAGEGTENMQLIAQACPGGRKRLPRPPVPHPGLVFAVRGVHPAAVPAGPG